MPPNLQSLRERCAAATGADRVLDGEIWCAVNGYEFVQWDGAGCVYRDPQAPKWEVGIKHAPAIVLRPYTASIDATIALVERVLPGWWITSGLCALSGHASIGPDYNGPERERLLREFPEDQYDHGGFDADLSPGDGTHRQCLAIIDCLLQVLERMSE